MQSTIEVLTVISKDTRSLFELVSRILSCFSGSISAALAVVVAGLRLITRTGDSGVMSVGPLIGWRAERRGRSMVLIVGKQVGSGACLEMLAIFGRSASGLIMMALCFGIATSAQQIQNVSSQTSKYLSMNFFSLEQQQQLRRRRRYESGYYDPQYVYEQLVAATEYIAATRAQHAY